MQNNGRIDRFSQDQLQLTTEEHKAPFFDESQVPLNEESAKVGFNPSTADSMKLDNEGRQQMQ